jgi:hypothetical protein
MDRVQGSFERGHELSGSIKWENFDQLKDW